MSSAEVEKEKGNAAFKAGDFATAVGHYSAAIIADRTDHTLPLNRAAAYLKLDKYEDAEHDCTTVLSLPKGRRNVKALYRRSLARIAIGKRLDAENDLNEALRAEPNNELVKAELKQLYMKESERKKLSQSTTATNTNQAPKSTPTSKPYRRRVPIKLVESPAPGLLAGSSSINPPESVLKKPSPPPTSSQPVQSGIKGPPPSHLEAVSTRILSPSSPGSAQKPLSSTEPHGNASSPAATSPSLSEYIPTREVHGKKVGGGIFRHSGSEALRKKTDPSVPTPAKFEGTAGSSMPPRDVASFADKPATSLAPSRVSAQPISKPPTSLFDFIRSWGAATTPDARWELLQKIPPSSIPTLFLTSLEPSMLVSILQVFTTILSSSPSESDRILEYMVAFPNTKRFGTILLFLSKQEEEAVQQVWSMLRPGMKVGEGVSTGWKP